MQKFKELLGEHTAHPQEVEVVMGRKLQVCPSENDGKVWGGKMGGLGAEGFLPCIFYVVAAILLQPNI